MAVCEYVVLGQVLVDRQNRGRKQGHDCWCFYSIVLEFCVFCLKQSSPLLLYSGDVPRVDGQLAVARAFGDKSLKMHLSSEPDVVVELIDDDTEFLILASDGVWKVSYLHHQSVKYDWIVCRIYDILYVLVCMT